MDLTENLRFSHNLCKPVVAFFSDTTLISMQFEFSRHITGPFGDPFVDHFIIFVLKTQGSSVIFRPPFHHAMPCRGGSVAPSPATLSPVSEGGFLTTIKASSREATRIWAIPVSDHYKGDKEAKFLIDFVLWRTRSSGTSRVLWCASPAGYMCAITSCIYAVCDDYLFKSVGSLAGIPRPCKGADNQQDEYRE